MSEHILVNVTPRETRVALLEEGTLQDIHIERAVSRGIVGNIYVGKVVRVLPGMQAAFVDIGLERTGFIAAKDIVIGNNRGREDKTRASANITEHLHDGKKIIVQVTRDALGTKGPRLTTRLSVSARYLVLLPQTDHMSVSQLIEDPLERTRLQQVLAQALIVEDMQDTGGFILRTAAKGVGSDDIVTDLRYLTRLWTAVLLRAKSAVYTELLYEELPLPLRIVRDLTRSSVARVYVDNRKCFAQLLAFCDDYAPELAGLLEFYSGEPPLFDLHGVENEIQRALARRVELDSGGYLVIDQTEAMTTIDVNTGSFVGTRNQAETLLKTNLEAAAVVARQVRVRNLGGIIIVDFIDMDNPEHRRQVHQVLEELMQRDPMRTQITRVSELGLVEITRKRTRESLEQTLCEDCPVCEGRGVVKTAETACHEIFRQIIRDARTCGSDTLQVVAAQAVVDRLRGVESAYLADLEECVGKTISLQIGPSYRHDRFDIRPL